MNKIRFFSVLAIGGAALGFALNGTGVSASVHSQAISRPLALRPTIARFTVPPMRRPARYRAAGGDRFIRSFAAPHVYPMLSQLNMDLYATAPGLPRYAPGADPIEKVKADRDQHGTQLGSLFISDRGLTLNLF